MNWNVADGSLLQGINRTCMVWVTADFNLSRWLNGDIDSVMWFLSMVQSRRPGRGGTLTVEDHKIEVVRRFK
jgi:hypothetical protein